MRIGSLASGYGGLDMGVQAVLSGDVAWHCEYDTAPSKVLAHHWPDVPNLGDITAIDWTEVEPVDVLVGGYPCQPFSHAGKRRGIEDERHIWPWIADAIRVLRPRLLVFENVAGHLRLGFDTVLADLAAMGAYDVRWGLVRASDTGAPHRRERLWIVAQAANADWAGPQQSAGRHVMPTGGHRADVGMTLLPTPKASDGPNGGPGMRNGRGEDDALPGVVSLLPTPRAQNGEDRNNLIWARPAGQPQNLENALANFGPYAAAVARWNAVLGRRATSPTEPGKDGRPRLSPAFVEWMMGLPLGHVTDPAIGLTRAQQLKALGNGVVPAQAALALRLLLSSPAGGVTRPDPARSAGVGASPLLPTPARNPTDHPTCTACGRDLMTRPHGEEPHA